MNPDNEVRRWQFSLRNFLVAVLIVGPLAGIVGPIILESITEWKPPPQPNSSRTSIRPTAPSPESENYYETGETPLN